MNENIEHFSKIVHDKSAGKVPGVGKVDLFTASMVKTVHDKLSPKNREKYAAMHPKKMIDVAIKLHRTLKHEEVDTAEHTVIHKPPHVPHDIARLHYDYQHVKRPKDRGLKPKHVDYKHVKRPHDRDLRKHNDYVIDDVQEQYSRFFGEASEVDDTDKTPTDTKRRRAADQQRTHWDWKGINRAFSATMDPRESVADDLLNMVAEGRSVVSVVDMIEGAAHDDLLGGDQPHERGRHDHEPHSGHGDYAPHPDIGLLTVHTNHPGAAQDASEMDPDSEADDGDDDERQDEETMLREAVLAEAGEMFGPAREKANKARAAANKQVMGLRKSRSKGDGEGEGEGKKITARKGFLGVGADPKTAKGQSKGYLTGINYMAPAGRGGTVNLCGDASPGCTRSCLHTAGNPAHMATKEKSRIAKNRRFMGDRRGFMKDMDASITGAKKLAKKHGLKFAVRLNGTSDVGWEGQRSHGGKSPMEHHPDVQFYDYTKSQVRARKHREGKMPSNYHLTFSRDERPESHEFALDHVRKGGTAAVVFNVKKNGQLPKTWHGQRVIDGDKHDHRFLDKEEHGLKPHEGAWVGLRAKGDARHDTSGFVVHDYEQNP